MDHNRGAGGGGKNMDMAGDVGERDGGGWGRDGCDHDGAMWGGRRDGGINNTPGGGGGANNRGMTPPLGLR